MDSLKTKVDQERWSQAQKWEEEGWVKTQKMRAKYGKNIIWKVLAFFNIKPKYRGSDWNHWWKKNLTTTHFCLKILTM